MTTRTELIQAARLSNWRGPPHLQTVGGNRDLRGRQLLRELGHTKVESTARYLSLNVEDPPSLLRARRYRDVSNSTSASRGSCMFGSA